MELTDFVQTVNNFYRQTKVEQVLLLGWYLHTHKSMGTFSASLLRETFRKCSVEPPDMSVYLARMAKKKPPQLNVSKGDYKLDNRERVRIDKKYGAHPTTIAVTSILAQLPSKVPDLLERAFLEETLSCYRIKAYRAAIVMAWNLAFDHVQRWVLADTARISKFNTSLQIKYSKKSPIAVFDDFADMKENEVIETLKHSGLISANLSGILQEKLKRRNRAAHPSDIVISQHQADDTITDLVSNVVLKLI